jgi:uncharacterized membrane-anchored protein
LTSCADTKISHSRRELVRTFVAGHYREALVAVLFTWVILAEVIHSAYKTNVFVDAHTFFDAASQLASGGPLYSDTGTFIYLPLIPLVLKPFLHYGISAVVKIWFAFNLLSYVIAAITVSVLAAGRSKSAWFIYCGVLAVCIHNWAFSMELLGLNCDMILGLIFVFLIYSVRSNRPILFAVLVVIGTAFKFWMFGLLGYLLLKRQLKEALLCLALTAVMIGALFQTVGWYQLKPMMNITRLYSERKFEAEVVIQSINGFSDRHFKQNQQVKPLIENETLHIGFIVGCDLLILSYLFYAIFWRKGSTQLEETLKLCLFLASMFLVMPICHMSYAVVILPGIALLIFGDDEAPIIIRCLIIGLYLALTRIQIFSRYGQAHGMADSVSGLLISSPFFWFVALWIGLATALTLISLQKGKRITSV